MYSVLSTFFALGQTLPTYRHGIGIFQPAVDDAIALLRHRNAWIHVFPEGRVRQSEDLSMRYFKWGVARMILEVSCPTPSLTPTTTTTTGSVRAVQPIVVPMFIEGLQEVMHDSRGFPTFLPRLFKRVKCTYGDPIPDDLIAPFVDRWRELVGTIDLPRRRRPKALSSSSSSSSASSSYVSRLKKAFDDLKIEFQKLEPS